MGFKIGDRVEVNYTVRDSEKIITDTEIIPGKRLLYVIGHF